MGTMVDEKPTKAHGLTLNMRAPTAKLIEEYLVDFTYGTKGERTVGTPAPTPAERNLARAIDLGMKIGKGPDGRAQLLLPDQSDILVEFKRQLRQLAQGIHPWLGGPLRTTVSKKLSALIADVEAFEKRSVIDKLADKFRD